MARRNASSFIGLISDTHGLVRPEALRALAGASHIVHAGDVGSPEVLSALAALAPLTVVRGNNDRGAFGASLPEVARLELAGRRVFVVHELAHVPRHEPLEADVLVVGHSHKPVIEQRGGVLLVNPGSAGPRRFSLPTTVARLWLGERLRARIVDLEV
jgi:putative phosphoesterase